MKPIQDSEGQFSLKRHILEHVEHKGICGQLGRLLRDQRVDEIEFGIETSQRTMSIVKSYDMWTLAPVVAQFRPTRSTWLELTLPDVADRMGVLCLGVGSRKLRFYLASINPGEPLVVQPVVGLRLATSWRPRIDWVALAEGTWSPDAFAQQWTSMWLGTHIKGFALARDLPGSIGIPAVRMVYLAMLIIVVATSPAVDCEHAVAAA